MSIYLANTRKYMVWLQTEPMPRYTRAEMRAMKERNSRAGKASAARLSPEQRKARASKAAAARWSKREASASE